jgi:DNA polymerase III alpha subunit
MNNTPPELPTSMSLEQLLLRDDMWMGHSQRFTSRSAVDTGYEPLNTNLLNRGWPLGSLVEICQQGMQGEWQLFIDVDFEHQRREEVIQYIYRKYGRERAALTATVITYRSKSAVRDVGKALGMEESLVDHLTQNIAWWDHSSDLKKRFESLGVKIGSDLLMHFFNLVQQIHGFPKFLSQHTGGFVISESKISDLVPLENASMPDRTIIQWDKTDLEAMRLLKVDVLALGMLSAVRRALDYISAYEPEIYSIQSIPREDPETYDMLCRGDSVGVFQIESRAQIAMLPRLQPRCFYDLVIEIAIVRPGPIQGEMVHPYPFKKCKRYSDLVGLPHKGFVRISGIVTGKQRPGTASGVMFMSLEDETGTSNVIIWTQTQETFRTEILTGKLLIIKGTVEIVTEGVSVPVVHVIAGHIEDVTSRLNNLALKSRDFH